MISPRLLAVARGCRPRLAASVRVAHRTLFPRSFAMSFLTKKTPTKMPEFFGDLAAIRTRDPQLRRLLLYPAELRDHIIAFLNRLFRHIKSFLQTDVRFYSKNKK